MCQQTQPVTHYQLYYASTHNLLVFFFFQAEDGIRDLIVTGVQTCALPICREALGSPIPWKRLLEDAVRHAGDGFAVSPGQRRVTAGADALFAASAPAEVRSSFWPVYHPDRFADGRFVQADLAATLAAVSEGGDEEVYRGDLARRIVAGAHAVGSPLTLGDLAEHRAAWVEPLRVRYP